MTALKFVLVGCLALLMAACPVWCQTQLTPMLSGLSSPVFVTHAHDGSNRLFIVEQPGLIRILRPGSSTPTVFLDIRTRVLFGGEQGLLGLAFHPQYAANGRFFVNYTRRPDGATVIAQYLVSASNADVAETAETILLTIPQPYSNHNGGMIAFGPDTDLYIGMGDGGSANDPGNRAQNINELLGKILRIDVDRPSGALAYSSPSDNPFFGDVPGRDEIYAVGLRNPWRFSFDRQTGLLYAADVGQEQREEIDLILRGGNYGWRVIEGTRCTNNDAALCARAGYIPPLAEYGHTGGRCSITGGYVYRGTRGSLPVGAYVYGDYCTGEVFLMQNGAPTPLLNAGANLTSFGEDEAGEIYLVRQGGTLSRLTRVGGDCIFALSTTSAAFYRRGGAGSFTLTAPNGCAWTATTTDAWIRLTSAAGGTGNATVTYVVGANTTGRDRFGSVLIAGQVVLIFQSKNDQSRTPSLGALRPGASLPRSPTKSGLGGRLGR
jgi:glucose/arabinose dehydrogenase